MTDPCPTCEVTRYDAEAQLEVAIGGLREALAAGGYATEERETIQQAIGILCGIQSGADPTSEHILAGLGVKYW